MKKQIIQRCVLASTCLFITALGPAAFGQGALTPSGAPAPTMKTLAQIEPRTPISSAPFTISVPGSYYLTTNLTVASGDAITIANNNVTLDLSGFTISSTYPGAGGYGIRLNSGLRNLTILNGFIQGGVTNNGSGVYSGSGFGYGIYYSAGVPANTRVSGVSVSGCLYHGIYLDLGDSTVVESCMVRTVGSAGIIANIIRGSVARDCGGQAISGTIVSDSQGQSTGGSDGLDASEALNCVGSSSSGYGLWAYYAQNCSGNTTSGAYGLLGYSAQNCSGYSSSGTYGLWAYTAQNCSGGTTSGSYGLYADYTAQNSYGTSTGSGYGLFANEVAIGCYGSSSSGIGLHARTAAFCTGWRSGGRAIEATVGNGCYASAGTNLITYKYNMP